MSLEPLRTLFQWSDNEGEASRYASSATINSEQTGMMSVNTADNLAEDLRRWMEAQEQTSKTQQDALKNIQ